MSEKEIKKQITFKEWKKNRPLKNKKTMLNEYNEFIMAWKKIVIPYINKLNN
jgi:hypothetical protein|tara:strand:- start:273 stop:428 length:156 start_codon:yes stop_codon:yes gene_type:complete